MEKKRKKIHENRGGRASLYTWQTAGNECSRVLQPGRCTMDGIPKSKPQNTRGPAVDQLQLRARATPSPKTQSHHYRAHTSTNQTSIFRERDHRPRHALSFVRPDRIFPVTFARIARSLHCSFPWASLHPPLHLDRSFSFGIVALSYLSSRLIRPFLLR